MIRSRSLIYELSVGFVCAVHCVYKSQTEYMYSVYRVCGLAVYCNEESFVMFINVAIVHTPSISGLPYKVKRIYLHLFPFTSIGKDYWKH